MNINYLVFENSPKRVVLCRSHSPHGVGAVTGAVFVTDEAIETRGTESLLAIRAFKASFTQTGTVDVMTLGSILTLTLLVTLQTEAAHRTVVLTPGGHNALFLKLEKHCVLQSKFGMTY